ncbi:hypothetical protein MSAN_01893500 [Mycena sanguinolenta]|uniref:Uncharacterized protein n=1 Tax=Mycena sanguinolenta TaxID=230812 RepID=A0A8H6XRJ5_9AGAR|nr:hypothetical protein MSAN_01893500 [Mycena sanguinolenta]
MSTSPLQGYDQIVAVSQGQINMSLDARFTGEVLEWDVKENGVGHLTGRMLPPTVALFIPGEPAKTRFCLNFESGSFTYYSYTDDDEQVKHVVDVAGWTVAFTVKLSLDAIQQLPEDVKKKITLPGSYSVSQLLLDFTTADLMSFDRSLSFIPATANSKPLGEDPDRDQALANMIDKYLRRKVLGTDHGVLGYYAVTAPTNPTPSFPPTSVHFQTMAYQPTSPTSFNNDCILFQEMTGGHKFPDPPYIGWKQWNWISEKVDDSRHAGCMVLSRENFWNNFFVPHATVLNRLALDLVKDIGDVCLGKLKVPIFPTSAVNPAKVPDSALGWTQVTEKQEKWEWHAKYEPQVPGEDKVILRDVSATVDLTLDSAAQKITMSTSCSFSARDLSHIIDDTDHGRERKMINYMSGDVTWGLELTLDNVADGGLAFRITTVTPTANAKAGAEVPGLGLKELPDSQEYTRWLIDAVEKMAGREVPEFKAKADEAFKHQAQFVFPGGGTFFMKNPSFNAAGDIVVGLQYKQE